MNATGSHQESARPGLMIFLVAMIGVATAVLFIFKSGSDSSSSHMTKGNASGEGQEETANVAGGGADAGLRLIGQSGQRNSTDPDAEPSTITRLGDSFEKALQTTIAVDRDRALSQLAVTFASADPESAVELMHAHARNRRFTGALAHFSQAFGRALAAHDLGTAQAYLDEIPASLKAHYSIAVGKHWASQDAGAATQWALQRTDPELQSHLLSAISGVVEQSSSPLLIDAWAGALSQSPYGLEYSDQLSRVWPISNADAAMEWVGSIADPQRRSSAYHSFAESMAGFVKPHLPFTAPETYWDRHDPNAFSLMQDQRDPEQAPGFAGKRGGEMVNYAPLTIQNLKEPTMQRKLLHGYYAAASFVDAQIGKVLDALDRLDLADDTIVVLWGDHGWHLGDHGYWTKHTNYEQANRIPIIIRAPQHTKAGTVSHQLVETVDLYPTLAALAGLPAPSGPQPIDGINLLPILEHPDRTLRDHAYHCYPRGQRMGRAIRTDRYRLVEWKRPGAADATAVYELYDYLEDPHETRNLAQHRPEALMSMRSILARHPEARPRQ